MRPVFINDSYEEEEVKKGTRFKELLAGFTGPDEVVSLNRVPGGTEISIKKLDSPKPKKKMVQ